MTVRPAIGIAERSVASSIFKYKVRPGLFGMSLDEVVEMLKQSKTHIEIGLGLGGILKGDPAIPQIAPTFSYASLGVDILNEIGGYVSKPASGIEVSNRGWRGITGSFWGALPSGCVSFPS
jgi:hypothetical protein